MVVRRGVHVANAEPMANTVVLAADEIVINADWERGQLSSIQAAIRSLPAAEGLPGAAGLAPAPGETAKQGATRGTDGSLLCLIDHPPISADFENVLIAQLSVKR